MHAIVGGSFNERKVGGKLVFWKFEKIKVSLLKVFTTSVSKHEQVVDLKAYTQQTLALSIKNDTLIIQNVTTTIPIVHGGSKYKYRLLWYMRMRTSYIRDAQETRVT